jgi:peptide/nickel transport system substrate-binding protein
VAKDRAGFILALRLSLSLFFSIACGTGATPTPTALPLTDNTVASTPVPTALPAPATVSSAKDSLILVAEDEPQYADMLIQGGGGTTTPFAFMDNISDTLVWADAETRELVPLSGAERWEQIDTQRWRFYLRPGVKFHNGEPWNAQAAKYSLDITGQPDWGHSAYTYAGEITGEVVDDHTLDVICAQPCPILGRESQFFRFEAPENHQKASEEERNRKPVGFGPFVFVEWSPGQFWKIERYPDYVPAPGVAEAQKAALREVRAVWRGEPTVRAAMVKAGEADLAYDIGVENMDAVPVAKSGGSAEVIAHTIDTLWHPALKKLKVRQALVHAIDCQAIVDSFYAGLTTCRGNVAFPGTIGITERNNTPFPYDPDKARQLLQEAGYNGEEIYLYGRAGRIPKAVEVYEALVSCWREVGINAEVRVVESSVRQELQQTGCGSTAEPLRCAELGPGEPGFASAHIFDNAISGETLDFGRQARRYMDCFTGPSHYCEPERVQPLVEQALAARGEERRQLMEQLADIMHDEVLMIPLFDYLVVWGLNDKLEWEPRWDRRIRFNNMSFRP